MKREENKYFILIIVIESLLTHSGTKSKINVISTQKK